MKTIDTYSVKKKKVTYKLEKKSTTYENFFYNKNREKTATPEKVKKKLFNTRN